MLEKINLKEAELRKVEMAILSGGTSTTCYKECGVSEMEYPQDKDGNPDFSKEGTLVDLPI